MASVSAPRIRRRFLALSLLHRGSQLQRPRPSAARRSRRLGGGGAAAPRPPVARLGPGRRQRRRRARGRHGGGAPPPPPPKPADAGPPGDGPIVDPPPMPPPGPDEPLPPCKRTVDVTDSGALATAIGGAQAGDCIVLADGTYTFPNITAKGTAAAPIVIRAANRLKADGHDRQRADDRRRLRRGRGHATSAAPASSRCRTPTTAASRASASSARRGRRGGLGAGHRHQQVLPRRPQRHRPAERQVSNMIQLGGAGPQIVQYTRIDHNHFHDVTFGGGNGWELIRAGLSAAGRSPRPSRSSSRTCSSTATATRRPSPSSPRTTPSATTPCARPPGSSPSATATAPRCTATTSWATARAARPACASTAATTRSTTTTSPG